MLILEILRANRKRRAGDRVKAELSRAGWLVQVSSGHLFPKSRLQLARAHVDEARRLRVCPELVERMNGMVENAAKGSAPDDGELGRIEALENHCSDAEPKVYN